MRYYLRRLHEQYLKPFGDWIRRFVKDKDDDDHFYDHPWAIL